MNKELYIRMNSSPSYTITVEPNDIGYTIDDLWDDIQSAIDHNVPCLEITAENGIVIQAFYSLKLSKVRIFFHSVNSIDVREVADVSAMYESLRREPIEVITKEKE